MRIIFLGTPKIAVKTLEVLLKSDHEVIAVVTQPDKKCGRGKKIAFSPIKLFALSNNLPLFQFESIKKEGVKELKELKPDIMITFAYGQILSEEVLKVAPHGVINVHASILPKYRGAAPINWAIINGEKETGITIMQTATGVDNGDMISLLKVDITEEDDAGTLAEKISNLSPKFLLETLQKIESGKAVWTKQDESKATHYPMMRNEFGKINFNETAEIIVNLVRGTTPSPGAYFSFNEKTYKVFKVKKAELDHNEKNGTVLVSSSKQGLIVACGNGQSVEIVELQEPNGKRMQAKSYLCGKKIDINEVLV